MEHVVYINQESETRKIILKLALLLLVVVVVLYLVNTWVFVVNGGWETILE